MGEQKPEKTKKHICAGLLAHVLGKYMGYGVIGVWFAHAIVDWTVRGAIFLLRYRSGKWETMGIKT